MTRDAATSNVQPLALAAVFAAILGLGLTPVQAAPVAWDGGGTGSDWSTTDNWDGGGSGAGGIPGSNDDVTINNGDTVNWDIGGNLPGGLTVDISGNSVLTNGPVIRLNGAEINVASDGGLAGAFWDLQNATLNFVDGATATMGNWENKGTNVFTFELGASGFATLLPGTFRNDGNNNALTLAQKMALATYEADLANYTGGVGVITLIDYSSDSTGLDDATFQNATTNEINLPSSLRASIQWNDTDNAVELHITEAPTPSTLPMALAGLAGVAAMRRRRVR